MSRGESAAVLPLIEAVRNIPVGDEVGKLQRCSSGVLTAYLEPTLNLTLRGSFAPSTLSSGFFSCIFLAAVSFFWLSTELALVEVELFVLLDEEEAVEDCED